MGIQELGPRFTLKLRSLQKGTFDSKFGEYEWVHKVCLSNTRPAWEVIMNLTLTRNLSLKKNSIRINALLKTDLTLRGIFDKYAK